MLSRWQNSNCSKTRIGPPALFPCPRSEASLVTQWRWSFPSSVAEKKFVREVHTLTQCRCKYTASPCGFLRHGLRCPSQFKKTAPGGASQQGPDSPWAHRRPGP